MALSKSKLWLLGVTLVFLAGCGQKFNNAKETQKASEEIDRGVVNDSVYKNQYFGLSIEIPKDWNIQKQSDMDDANKENAEALASESAEIKAALEVADLTSVNLLSVCQFPVGSPVPSNPNIDLVAERIRHMPGIEAGGDYLYHVKTLFQTSQTELSFPREMSIDKFGGKEFTALYIDMPIEGTTIHQTFYATIMKGYAILFITSYTTDEEETSLREILDTLTFK